VWFFQGMERMKYITFLNILAKALFTIAIFIFVKEESDYWMVPLLNSLGFVVAGSISLYVIFKNFNTRIKFPTKNAIIFQLKEGWHIFVSTVAISLYTISTPFILGVFTNNIIVGYYSAADKIVSALQSLLTPFSQTLYPYFSHISNISKKLLLKQIGKICNTIIPLIFCIFIVFEIFSEKVTEILFGISDKNIYTSIQILLFKFLFVSIAHVFANLFLLASGYVKNWKRMIFRAAFIGLNLTFFLVYICNLGLLGALLSVIVTEFFVLTSSIYYYIKIKKEII